MIDPATYEEGQRVIWMRRFLDEVLAGPGGMMEDELEAHVADLLGMERRNLNTLRAWHWETAARTQRRRNNPDEVAWDTRGDVARWSEQNAEDYQRSLVSKPRATCGDIPGDVPSHFVYDGRRLTVAEVLARLNAGASDE